jgi:hypothetical protein
MTTAEEAMNCPFAKLLVILSSIFLIAFLSACSNTNPGPAANGAGYASTSSTATSPASAAVSVSAGSVQMTPSAPTAATPLAQEHLIGVGSATVLTIHGRRVVSVNRAKKQVTLEGPGGKLVTLQVYNPYNLAAAKAGEPFVAKFYEIVTNGFFFLRLAARRFISAFLARTTARRFISADRSSWLS